MLLYIYLSLILFNTSVKHSYRESGFNILDHACVETIC